MSIVTSRRGLIIGVTSLIAVPYLARAESLMSLRGYQMDPNVLAYLDAALGFVESQYSNTYKSDFRDGNMEALNLKAARTWRSLSPAKQADFLINQHGGTPNNWWTVMRRSELDKANENPRWRSLPFSDNQLSHLIGSGRLK